MAFASVMTAASEMRCLWCIYLERARAPSREPVVGASVAGGASATYPFHLQVGSHKFR